MVRVVVEPSITQWQVVPRSQAHRRELADVADRFSDVGLDPSRPIIATGHQASLWHPGILAKFIAASVAARRLGAQPVHLFVDHDDFHPYGLNLPLRDGDRLRMEWTELAYNQFDCPPVLQPSASKKQIIAAIDALTAKWSASIAVDLAPLRDAWPDGGASSAHQVAQLLNHLMSPLTGPMPLVSSTALMTTPSAKAVVDRMLADARSCVEHYNRAVGAVPEARLSRLAVGLDRVELPLWAMGPRPKRGAEGRRRVFADLADSMPLLVDDSGRPIALSGADASLLAPRALLLTALMRSFFCDFFIHGTGGALYDRVTEAWWRQWRGEDLAPMAMITADMQLPLAAPVAEPGELERARWMAHHLPHNVDRFVPADRIDAGLLQRKREILTQMNDDRDHRRRERAFLELKSVNAILQAVGQREIDEATANIERLRIAVANREVAGRRDWFFGLYSDSLLMELKRTIEELR